MKKSIVILISIFTLAEATIGVSAAPQRLQNTEPNCHIDYLDGQLIQCCEVESGKWQCRPYK